MSNSHSSRRSHVRSPILKGLDTSSLPTLLGYNGSTIKPTADIVLKSPAGDPILAQWQYGLGRSVAWTPDVKGRWATSWVTWPKFSQFAGQMLSWVLPPGDLTGLQTSFSPVVGTSTSAQDVNGVFEFAGQHGRTQKLPEHDVNSNLDNGHRQERVHRAAVKRYVWWNSEWAFPGRCTRSKWSNETRKRATSWPRRLRAW